MMQEGGGGVDELPAHMESFIQYPPGQKVFRPLVERLLGASKAST